MSEVIVGIDLGTTNSLIGVCENGIPRVLQSIPSVVHLASDLKLEVGGEAKKWKTLDSSHTAYSVKRFIGRGKKDLTKDLALVLDTSLSTDENILIKLGEKAFSAIELSAVILGKLKSIAEKELNGPVKKAVITVPAYFDDSQRSATKAAGTLAGLDVVRIVNEPTAAALAYGLNKKKNGLIAVYDLGGGTFDVSLLRLHDGIFEVLSTNGNTQLGGDDFDQLIFNILAAQVIEQGGAKDFTRETAALVFEIAENFKHQFSEKNRDESSSAIEISGKTFNLHLKKSEFELAISTLVMTTIELTADALKDAGLDPAQVDEVILVGGSTRVDLVRKMVQEFFKKEPNTSQDPDEAVALGAAIQGDILSGKNQGMVLLDVVPLSLGIETYGGTVGKLIHRNSKIPAIAKETFTTHVEGQKNVLIHILQGERELAKDCRSLARFNLIGLPPMPAGLPKIEVSFLIDANGILKVKARELQTNTQSQIEVTPSYGLTDEQVEKMLEQSFEFAEEDLKARQLIDTRVEAEGVLVAAEKILKEGHTLASDDEISQIKKAMGQVKSLIQGEDYIAIKNALEELEVVAKSLAGLVMNHALKAKVIQKSVDSFLKR